MSTFKRSPNPLLEESVMVRVPNGTKNLLKQLAKKRQSNVSEVCREILEQALHLEFSAEQLALQRFETLQAELNALSVKLGKMEKTLSFTHQMSTSVLVHLAAREIPRREGTEAEVGVKSRQAMNQSLALGTQISERIQREILDK